MVTVFISYRLTAGVTREEYRRWSVDVDQPTASRQPSVQRYEIYEAPAGEGSPWDFMEVIDADSREAWERVNDDPEMQPVAEAFFAMCDRDTLRVTYAERV